MSDWYWVAGYDGAFSPATGDSPIANKPIPPHYRYILWQQIAYPRQLWVFVGAGIGFLSICNLVRLWCMRSRKQALLQSRVASQAPDANVHLSSDVPNALPTLSRANRLRTAGEAAFKIFAFRWSIPFGRSYALSWTEVFFTVGYLAAVLIWSFVH
ncbi:hypothetical protein FRC17_006455, partial [Serendipita sp. 399]